MLPVATLTGLTATGDCVVGPGAPNLLVDFLPVACLGDAVAGPMCVGSLATTTSMVLVDGRPAATLTSMAVGVNPAAMGIPASVPVVMTEGMTSLF
jgi:uncharacterized Zn-binding protein involved in type VI secretion